MSDAATKGEKLESVITRRVSGYPAECTPNFSGCVFRLQRPNVYLPVHLYGQLVHDKTGCHLLEAQVTPSASFVAVPQHTLFFLLIFYFNYSGEQWVVQI